MEGTGITARGFEFFAFISYSRKDEKWARWLQQNLEEYRLPSALCKEMSHLPKHIRPVFRDKTDLSTGRLEKLLHHQMDISKKMILICSPNSAQSEWVDNEVRYFIESGRYGDIIPFIVDGEPTGERKCFPPSLLGAEEDALLGASVPELGRSDAFLRVVSGLLEIKYDNLRRRHIQRKNRIRAAVISAAVFIFAALAAVGYRAWDYFAPHEAYYADYILRRGVPEGVGLEKDELAERNGYYAIVTRRGQAVKLSHLNSVGEPTPHNHSERRDRPMIAEYLYTDDGNVRTVEYLDKNGNVLVALTYSSDLRSADFQRSEDDSTAQTLQASTASTDFNMFEANALLIYDSTRSDITRHRFEYDPESGYLTKVIYMRDNRDTPLLDADGIGGIEYVNDELGRPVLLRYLGLNGNGYAATKQNVAGKRYTYDENNNLIKMEILDPQGNLVLGHQKWAACEDEFDAHGNPVKETFFGTEGTPALNYKGYAIAEYEYDERGMAVRAAYMGTDGKPVFITDGFSSMTVKHDERGRAIESVCRDTFGKPVINAYGYASERTEYYDNGSVKQFSYYNTDGEPALNHSDYSVIEYEYNERGKVTKEAYYGTNGQPVYCAVGYSVRRLEYDENGRLVKEAIYGLNGEPVYNTSFYASLEYEYDGRGNMAKISCFDTNGQPVLCGGGYAYLAYTYNESGFLSETRYFGTDGEPTIASGAYAFAENEYDLNGNITQVAFFGVNGEPVFGLDGYSSFKNEYDRLGNVIRSEYFGADGAPVLMDEGHRLTVFMTRTAGLLKRNTSARTANRRST